MVCFSVTCDVPKGPWSSVALQTPSVNGPKLTGILVNCCLLLFPLRAVNSNHHISLPVLAMNIASSLLAKENQKEMKFFKVSQLKDPNSEIYMLLTHYTRDTGDLTAQNCHLLLFLCALGT